MNCARRSQGQFARGRFGMPGSAHLAALCAVLYLPLSLLGCSTARPPAFAGSIYYGAARGTESAIMRVARSGVRMELGGAGRNSVRLVTAVRPRVVVLLDESSHTYRELGGEFRSVFGASRGTVWIRRPRCTASAIGDAWLLGYRCARALVTCEFRESGGIERVVARELWTTKELLDAENLSSFGAGIFVEDAETRAALESVGAAGFTMRVDDWSVERVDLTAPDDSMFEIPAGYRRANGD